MIRKYFLVFLLSFNLWSQENTFKVDYDLKVNFTDVTNYKSVLYVNNAESIFLWNNPLEDYKMTTEGTNTKINIILSDSIGSFNYRNFATGTLYSRVLHISESSFIVKENIPDIEWEILTEHKIINNFNCQKAITNFRGREYTVWFTNEIPISVGPWKLAGLPGLMVYGYDSTYTFEFNLTKLSKDTYQINKITNDADVISLDEYAEISKSYTDDFVKKLKSKLPRGATIKVDKMKGLEIFD